MATTSIVLETAIRDAIQRRHPACKGWITAAVWSLGDGLYEVEYAPVGLAGVLSWQAGEPRKRKWRKIRFRHLQ